jgi:hypothetical protein
MPGDRNLGPPEVSRLGTPLPAGDTTTSTPARIKTSSCHLDSRCRCRRNGVGRSADVWREGFGYGFRDALRLAQRQTTDPAVWLMLDRLADDYDLAGDQ